MYDMTHSCVWDDVWRDSFIYVTWLISHAYMWRGSFMCATWLIHTCDMTHSYMWCGLRYRIHTCDAWFICVCHIIFINVTWLIYICEVTHPYMRHDSFIHVSGQFIRVTWLINSYVWHDWSIHTCDMTDTCDVTHSHTWHDLSIPLRMASTSPTASWRRQTLWRRGCLCTPRISRGLFYDSRLPLFCRWYLCTYICI